MGAWICTDLHETLIMDDGTGNMVPTEGAVEAMTQLAGQGHRLTIFTAAFAPMPDDRKQQMKEEIEALVQSLGFPPMDVWTGTTKPGADIFIDNKAVTFDNDWDLALQQVDMMLEDQGLLGPPPVDDGSGSYPGAPTDEEMPEQ